jgi:predicted nucleotidyltransferase
VVSYVEEFRLQVETGERVVVRGNLEEVETRNGSFHQITLSYGREYFDQVLKPACAQ